MKYIIVLTLALVSLIPITESFAQISSDTYINAPFDRDFIDIKFLDAYFGTIDEKIEVEAGDMNVPLTIVFTNVGTQDITGIRGQLSLPFEFSPAIGSDSITRSDSNTNAAAGENFHLTFYVNIEPNAKVQQYPAAVKLDYSRVRESGVRNEFVEFRFHVTGDSIVNVRSMDSFLTSLQSNQITFEISNDGTAPISGVEVEIPSSNDMASVNIENVVMSESNWDLGNIAPKSSKIITTMVYVPEGIKDDTLRIPLVVTYYNTQSEQNEITRIMDFYIKGLIDLKMFNINVIELSNNKIIVGEIINEGNQDGLFGFISLEPRKDSNLRSQLQFIDEIEVDSPVPFNIPIEFEGQPVYGEHHITLNLRYKDSTRDEMFLQHDAMIVIHEPPRVEETMFDPMLLLIPAFAAVGIGIAVAARRKRSSE